MIDRCLKSGCIFVLVAFGMALTACSDQVNIISPQLGVDSGTGGADVADEDAIIEDSGQTVTTDTSEEDTSEDAQSDVPPDAEEDAQPDAIEPPWPWDYPEPECMEDADCEAPLACFGGACVAQVEPETYMFRGLTVVTDIHLPSTEEEPCCFDLDGNGTVDNTMATLAALYGAQSGDSIADSLNQILDRDVHMLLELKPSDVEGDNSQRFDVGLFTGSSDIDSDGVSDFSAEQRAEGSGVYRIDSRGVGPFGPLAGFPRSLVDDDGFLRTTAANFDMAFPLGEPCSWVWHTEEPLDAFARCRSEQPVPIGFSGMRIEGPLRIEDNGVYTDVTDAAEGGVAFGGYVHLDVLKDILNASYGDNCQCIGLERDEDIFVSNVRSGRYLLECKDEYAMPNLSQCEESNRSCPGIADLCQLVPLIASLAEFDSVGDNVPDSISFGMRATLAPATLDTEQTFIPPRERCGTMDDEDGDGLAGCDDPHCWDDVNCGAKGWGEQCHNGRDDDGDGLIDCDDHFCRENRACLEE